MREAKRRYWESDPRYEGWIFSEPEKSTEDEFFASLEDEPEDLMPEIFLAMRCLTPKQRFVIECRYGIGTRTNGRQMNVDEIGEVLGVSHVAVLKLLRRAYRRLEKELWRTRTATKTNTLET